MAYCINPQCPQPQNSDQAEQCFACGSRLQYGDELLYRAIQPLMGPRKNNAIRLYEVHQERKDPLVMKVLSSTNPQLVALFEQEVKILKRFTLAGVPKFESYFEQTSRDNQQLRCLVMEKIAGINLEEWLAEHGAAPHTIALDWLRQLATLLGMIHRHGFLHQDLKPANIICKPNHELALVDFSNVPGVVSAGYSPPEQAEGNAIPQSDFFALGRTFVHLLTGKHPLDLDQDPATRQVLWRSQVPEISTDFADLIDSLMAPAPSQRPPNAQILLDHISEIPAQHSDLQPVSTQPAGVPRPISKKRFGLTLAMILSGWGVALVVIASQFQLVTLIPTSTCDQNADDAISCGEQAFFQKMKNNRVPQEKEQGITAWRNQNYKEAIAQFQKARDKDISDPETLIYLNNAQLALQETEPYTIAVVAPLSPRPELSKEVLRGVAQAQHNLNLTNRKINGKGLRVLIADDANIAKNAKDVAKQLIRRNTVIGIVGHYASEMTLAPLKAHLYQRASLPLVSYGSTSTDLSGYGFAEDRVFYRTVPTAVLPAIALASYLKSQATHEKVAVFYNPNSPFSRSLYDFFKVSLEGLQGQVLNPPSPEEHFNLCQEPFDTTRYLRNIQAQQATAIAIFPDGRVCDSSYPNAMNIVRSRNKSLPIVGSWLFVSDTLKESQNIQPQQLENFIVAAPWNRFAPLYAQSPFLKETQGADTLWNRTADFSDDRVSGITAMAYDASQVFIQALKNLPNAKQANPSRKDIQHILTAPSFKATGATGLISFQGGDRKENLNVLLRVIPSRNCNSYGYSFFPLKVPLTANSLDCKSILSDSGKK
jgi:eukaryotic-like serine/threonine-protein kinase